ncbi:hypothetical protein [Fusobacterium necrophorum]|uniref:Uncharacterized protein n=2 Tax=Fusobacterium necrophorum TaxID=859 RepID=A0AAN3VTS1_9FUSO|nr:hypothetical protein [Fusobacterium necrophorum]AYV95555.1 hypothetical protein BWX37_08015 [Fusobacterium necrophorum subsp. funduliforme]EJU15234.1 hypothetical protein HMPREF1127_0319 [Fusobacterium necrophorum subsp. funduliforme Fnf 1007]KYL02053.1 hypothetical protein A2J06_02965 [Fusobacterium necrophorum subsp. funduliforme]KYM40142.1 hypothetical protein A2U03_05315 [Fusobacterium necrophorum subsp. funduliforme]KYM41779.1 hypothetical protein A2U15_01480 [Fusobacterium necrophorum
MKMEEFISYFDKKVVVYFRDGTSRYGILSGIESEENEEGEYTGRELLTLDLSEHVYISFLPEEIKKVDIIKRKN